MENSFRTRPKERARSSIQITKYMKVNGRPISLMVKEYTSTRMGMCIEESLRITQSMVKESTLIVEVVQSIQAHLLWASNKVKVLSNMKMVLLMMDRLKKMNSTAKALSPGQTQTKRNMRAIGKKARCTERAPLHGKMEMSIKVSTVTTKDKEGAN